MFRTRTPLFASAALALAALTTVSFVEPAAAKRHRRTVRLAPAHQRPEYRGAPGFAGGVPGPLLPALVDPAIGPPNGDTDLLAGLAPPRDSGLLGGGGFLGTGVLPQTGVLTGVPVIGAFGL